MTYTEKKKEKEIIVSIEKIMIGSYPAKISVPTHVKLRVVSALTL